MFKGKRKCIEKGNFIARSTHGTHTMGGKEAMHR